MRTLLIPFLLVVCAVGAFGQRRPPRPRPIPPASVYPMKGCMPGFTNFGKFCYKYFWERLPWLNAQITCHGFRASPRAPRGYLITVKDMQHNRFQHNWLRVTGGSHNKVWMGLAEKTNNNYFWADGTPLLPFAWNRFKPDQPQLNHHIQGVHSFDNHPDNTWVTSSHETEMSFICQYQYMP